MRQDLKEVYSFAAHPQSSASTDADRVCPVDCRLFRSPQLKTIGGARAAQKRLELGALALPRLASERAGVAVSAGFTSSSRAVEGAD